MEENFKENTLKLSYKPTTGPAFQEDVKIEYMMQNEFYYIIETVKSSVLGSF
jgi:hypothetical protein